MRPTDPGYEQDILDKVERDGWLCTSVYDPEGVLPNFAYSVGFTATFRLPEFIIFGLRTSTAHSILSEVFRTLEGGQVPEDGQRWSNLIKDHDCVIRRVHPTQVSREHFNSAIWFWGDPTVRGEPLPAYQIVWPDRDGRFPWDAGCAQWVRDDQPALYIPKGH